VTPKRPESAADRELADHVVGQGFHFTARMVRTYRQAGLISKAIVIPQGYARIVLSQNPPEAFDQAMAIAEIRGGRKMAVEEIAFGLFARNLPVDEEVLKRAYRKALTDISRDISALTEGAADDLEAAEQGGAALLRSAPRNKMGRFMLRRAGQSGEPDLISGAMTVLGGVLAGQRPSAFDYGGATPDAIDELMTATGLRGRSDEAASIDSAAPSYEVVRQQTMESMAWILPDKWLPYSQRATLEQLTRNRDRGLLVLEFAIDQAALNAAIGGPKNAYGLGISRTLIVDDFSVAMLALIVGLVEENIDHDTFGMAFSSLPEAARSVRATRLLVEAHPRHLRIHLNKTPEEMEALDETTRSELREATEQFVTDFPDEAELLVPGVTTRRGAT